MATVFHCDIEGTNFSSVGEARIAGFSVTAASATRNGQGTIQLVYPYGAGYSFYPTMEVQLYRVVSGASYGILGGYIKGVTYETIQAANAANAYTLATLTCVDYNTLLDHITTDGDPSASITIGSGEFYDQVVATVQAMQENGYGTVNRALQVDTARVANLTGATVLPDFTINGESLRQVMRRLCATAQATDTALRPRFGLILDSDGAGGVIAAMSVWDGAVPPTSLATFAYEPTIGQRAVRKIRRVLEGGMPLLNLRQSTYIDEGATHLTSYQNDTSAATYFNRYLNTGNTGNTGHWTLPPIDDTTSTTSAEANALLEQSVEAVAYPRETLPVTFDIDRTSDTLFLAPGTGATLIWPPFGINSPGTLYEVAAVQVSLVTDATETYERVTVTLGLPMLELFDNGKDGAARAPIIGVPKLHAPTFDSAYTTGYEEGGGWARATIAAIDGAQSYNYYYRETSSGPYQFIKNSTDTAIILRGMPRKCTRYLAASAVNSAGKEGYRSGNKTVNIGQVPSPLPPPSWDEYNAEDSDLRGLEISAGLSTDLAWLTTPIFEGQVTLSMGRSGAASKLAFLGPKITISAGEVLTVGNARRRAAGFGPDPLTGLSLNWFDSSDSLISTDSIYSAIASTSFVYTEASKTAPALTAYARWVLIHDMSGGATADLSYFSQPRVTRTITSAASIALWQSSGDPRYMRDSGGVIRGQEYTDSSNVIYKGVNTGGSSPVSVQVVSSTNTDYVFLDATGAGGSGVQGTVSAYLSANGNEIRAEASQNTFLTGAANRPHVFSVGSVVLGASVATNATQGFAYLPSCAGTPTGTPVTQSGANAMVWDRTNKKLYVYDGGWNAMN